MSHLVCGSAVLGLQLWDKMLKRFVQSLPNNATAWRVQRCAAVLQRHNAAAAGVGKRTALCTVSHVSLPTPANLRDGQPP